MGTRHLQTVIDKNGVKRVSQYGQWDGYFSGQGLDIYNWLRSANLEKYQENLEKIEPVTKAQLEKIHKWGDNWDSVFFYMSRDCGAKIHKMIEMGAVPFVELLDLRKSNNWCEGFYTIDFQKGVFTLEYAGTLLSYDLNNLPDKETFTKDIIIAEQGRGGLAL